MDFWGKGLIRMILTHKIKNLGKINIYSINIYKNGTYISISSHQLKVSNFFRLTKN